MNKKNYMIYQNILHSRAQENLNVEILYFNFLLEVIEHH
jgi:hypothetical protein